MGRLLIVGAGAVGTAGAQAALADGIVSEIAGVIDPDPQVREQLRSDFGAAAYVDCADLPSAREGDRALVAFSSRAAEVAPDIVRLVSAGYHVVTTCEELAWPERHIRDALHTSAHSAGRVVLATGANPGFIMDRFPLLLAAASRSVKKISVVRRVDSAKRREQLVAKTGRGLSPEAFDEGLRAGTIGHVGLLASTNLLADGLDWPLHDVSERIQPIVVDGVVSGIHQIATLRAPDDRMIALEVVMDWDISDPGDHVMIDGDPPLDVVVNDGYHGDAGSTAQIVMALAHCHELSPGFHKPTDLPIHFG